MNYFETKDKSLCCGCNACASICPKNNIELKPDEDGFVYPVKKEICNSSCNLCVQVCPFAESESVKHKAAENCYAMVASDSDMVFKSTSGGAFTVLLESYLKDATDFVVFGSEMCSDLKVRHTGATTLEDCAKFRKSKYVKSDIGTTYVDARKALNEGKKVLFSGTPCQIAGLRKFLRKDYENLFTIDLVCHGVPNQKHFDKYLGYLEKKYKSRVVNYQFRAKNLSKDKGILPIQVSLESGQVLNLSYGQDYYLKAFNSSLLLMKACHNCQLATERRTSDITIADFWGINNYTSDFLVETRTNGVSLIIINSEKGSLVWSSAEKGKTFETPVCNAITKNQRIIKPSIENPKRERFLYLLRNKSFDYAVKKTIGKPGNTLSKRLRKLKRRLKNTAKKILGK